MLSRSKLLRSKFLFGVILFRVALDITYAYVITPQYWAVGLTLEPTIEKIVFSYCLMIGLAFVVKKREEGASSLILQYLYIVSIVPLCSFFGLSNFAINDQSWLFLLVVAAGFSLTAAIASIFPSLPVIEVKKAGAILDVVLPLVFLGSIFYAFLQFGIHFEALDFNDAYEIRANQKTEGLFGYLWTWCFRIIGPMLALRAWLKGRKKIAFLFIFFQILMYFITPYKEILFSLFLCFGSLFAVRRFGFAKTILIFFVIALFAASMIYIFGDSNTMLGVIPNRLLTIPAQTKFMHFDFFSTHELLHFSENNIGQMLGISYPYGDPAQFSSGNLIAHYFFGSMSNSNTGYLAYSYDNFGFLGIFVYSAILGFVLKYFDSFSSMLPYQVVFVLSLYPFAMLNDTDLLAGLLGGGIALLMILLPIMGQDGLEYKEKQIMGSEGKSDELHT